jgi:hypothetical protein
MKRDMDLIRRILLDTEASDLTDGFDHLVLDYGDDLAKQVQYQILQLKEAKLIETEEEAGIQTLDYWPTRLTWAGHEFLDAIRKDTLWQKVKAVAVEKTGGLGFEIVKALATKLAIDLALGGAAPG